MVGGQAYDWNVKRNKSIGIDGLKLLHKSKTGVIFKAAIDIAAILGDASPEQKKPDEYALHMGLTFQLLTISLILSVMKKTLGKPVGSDEKIIRLRMSPFFRWMKHGDWPRNQRMQPSKP